VTFYPPSPHDLLEKIVVENDPTDVIRVLDEALKAARRFGEQELRKPSRDEEEESAALALELMRQQCSHQLPAIPTKDDPNPIAPRKPANECSQCLTEAFTAIRANMAHACELRLEDAHEAGKAEGMETTRETIEKMKEAVGDLKELSGLNEAYALIRKMRGVLERVVKEPKKSWLMDARVAIEQSHIQR
jgi:hypothetical protein